jgi:60S ribosome subunit biogenesis protein NIP7
VKAHIGRWSEDCPEHQGVIVLKMDDTPLGSSFPSQSKYLRSSADARDSRSHSEVHGRSSEIRPGISSKFDVFLRLSLTFFKTGITVFRQADVGEYLREVSRSLESCDFWLLTLKQEDTLFTT